MINPFNIAIPVGFKIRGYHVPIKGDYILGDDGTAIKVNAQGKYPAIALDFDLGTEYEFSNMDDFYCASVKPFKGLNKNDDCDYKYVDNEGITWLYMRAVSK